MYKKVAQHILQRGATHYVRVRIPAQLRPAYPAEQTHVLENLQTDDEREAKARGHSTLARIYADFEIKRAQLDLTPTSLSPKRIEKLTDEELALVGGFYQPSVLQQDQARRQAGLDDDEFEELGRELASQRADLSRLLAPRGAFKLW
jgi:hypothetical protein